MALVSSASCAIFTLMVILLLLSGRHSKLSKALALLIMPYAIWSFGNALMFNAPDVATATYWDNFTALGWSFFPGTMLYFTFVFTDYSPKIPPILTKILYLFPPLIFISAQWSGLFSIADQKMWYGRTIRLADTPFPPLFTAYYLLLVTISLTLIAIHIKKNTGYKKKRSIIIFWSYLVAFLISAITEDFLPAIDKNNQIPPLVVVGSLVLVFGIIFAVMRYNMLLSLNPSGIMLYSLNQSRTALKNILDSYPHFMFVVDKKGLIHHANRNAIKKFADHKSALPEHNIEILFDVPQQKKLQKHLALVSETLLPQEQDYQLAGVNDSSFPATVTISPLTDPEHCHAGFIVSIIDITTYKEAEQSLENARDKAWEADRAKSEFLANISHELRTPMNAIIGFTNLLQETEKDNNTLGQLDIIHSSGTYLLALVNDLLDIARIESGKLVIVPQTVDVRKEVGTTSILFPSTDTIVSSVNIENSVPETLLIDPTRLRQVLTNLLSNAFKFTEKGSVKLTVSYHDNSLVISVADTGIGISKENQKRIFEKFMQEEGGLAKNRGTGIGLAIVKKLTTLMGGNIALESELNQGSTFTITLPHVDKVIEPTLFR